MYNRCRFILINQFAALLVSYNFNIALLLKKTSYMNNKYCVRNKINSTYVYELRMY